MKTKENLKVLFDNYEWQFDEVKQQIAEDEGVAVEEITENQVYQRMQDYEQFWWEDAIGTLQSISKGMRWIVMGYVGGWCGTRQGGNIFDDLDKMIQAITKDCDYVKIEYDLKGHLYIKSSHHDGNNSFECKLVTRKGYQAYDNWNYDYDTQKSEYEMLDNLWKCNVYTKLPHVETELGYVKTKKVS